MSEMLKCTIWSSGTNHSTIYIWDGGIGGHDLEGEPINEDVSLTALNNAIEELERKLVLQSKYLEELKKLLLNRI